MLLREVGARDAESEVGTREFSSQRKPQAVTGFWQALGVVHMTHSVVQNTAELGTGALLYNSGALLLCANGTSRFLGELQTRPSKRTLGFIVRYILEMQNHVYLVLTCHLRNEVNSTKWTYSFNTVTKDKACGYLAL